MVNGMCDLLSENINADVYIRNDAEYSVVKGAQVALKQPKLIENIDYQLKNIQDLIVEP